jgi:hypothetical protein
MKCCECGRHMDVTITFNKWGQLGEIWNCRECETLVVLI